MATVAEDIAVLRGTKPATLKDLFRHPTFSKLMAAMTVSSLGDWVGFVAVAALVSSLVHGPSAKAFAVAGMMMSRLLPSIVFGPFAGVLVDRVDRKRLMMTADIARGLMYASMPLLHSLVAIFALSFVIECLSLLWGPAKDSSIPNIVPRRQLENANTIGLASTYGTLPLGGLLFSVLAGLSALIGNHVHFFADNDFFLPLWLDAATFGFSAYMVSKLTLRGSLRTGEKFEISRVGRDIAEGFRFLKGHSLARAMTIGIVMGFAGVGSVMGLGPIFATESLHAGPTGFGVLVTAVGIGMGLGMASLGQITKFIEREKLFPLAMLGAAAGLFLVAAMPSILLAAVGTVVMGVFVGVTWVTGYALLQENIADEFRGRTFGALTVMSRLGLFASLVGFPSVAGALGGLGLLIYGRPAGPRFALWLGSLVVVLAGFTARGGLKRHRFTKPHPLSLLPRLKQKPDAGAFVSFEGVEGSGKGTQIERAREFLEKEGFEVEVCREPGGTRVGERLRDLLLDRATGSVEPRTEALLFAAARSQLVSTVIRPALAQGKVVLCDRYVDSSLAYQGVARGLGEQDVLTLNVWATQGLFPDLVILLHLDAEEGKARAAGDPDRIESEDVAFHAKVSDAYLRIAEEHPERFVVVDASKPEDEVHEEVQQALMQKLRPEPEEEPS
ncbi:MAG: dTMP kinase [Actinomycetota bacterium]